MTLEKFCSYIDENKGCPITEKFMKDGYMQGMVNGKIEKYSGYVRTARNRGFIQEDTKMISQCWHLKESYLPGYEDKDARRCYGYLRCPELLLWIAEVCGVDDRTLKDASKEARLIIDAQGNGRARGKAASAIRAIIPWSEIEAKIQEKTI